MAASNFTPISLYHSTTAAATPIAGNLVNGELAINITDGKLYYKDNAGVVRLIASTAALTSVDSISFGTTGLTPATATTGVVTVAGTLNVVNGGTGQTTYTDGQLLIGNTTGNTLTKSTLTAGTGISITNGTGSITIAATNSGTVTSVTFTGGIISVANGTTTPAFTVAGTSGGIPYFSSGTTWASSTALAANALVVGGGAGAAPSSITTGTGVVTALGVNTGSAGAFVVNGGALGAPSSGTVTNLTGTASININGTVGATTANTGAFTTVSASGVITSTITTGTAPFTVSSTTPVTNLSIGGNAAGLSTTLAVTSGGTGVTTTPTNGQLLIGNGTNYTVATLGTGTGISITAGSGTLQVNNTLPMTYPTGSGIAVVASGTSWGTTLTAPSGAIVGTTDTQTLTNKRVTPRIGTVTSASTITPTADSSDQYNVTALATTASFAIPSGTPTDGQKLSIRIYAGTTQTISWVTTAGGYRIIGTTLPTSVPATKTIYVGCVYNAADSFWDVVAVATQA